MIRRRLGPAPHADGKATVALRGCPDIFELEDGDFAIVGIDVTEETRHHLPADASCGPDERIVRLPRRLLVRAKASIPDDP